MLWVLKKIFPLHKYFEIINGFPKQLAVWEYLQTVDEATPQNIAEKADVARPTVNQVLTKLLELKKIERIGEGAAIRYRKLL